MFPGVNLPKIREFPENFTPPALDFYVSRCDPFSIPRWISLQLIILPLFYFLLQEEPLMPLKRLLDASCLAEFIV